ncbi:MAG: hypothetical protein KDE32_15505 [Novosphingobium sp.]|nr:hypothetical protein [Novosphingobium sp.]
MGEPKIFASLSPRLLARKGGAKPAMRPQVQPLGDLPVEFASMSQDDLGWNDMGDEEAPVVAETSAEIVEIASVDKKARKAAPPKVVEQQQNLAERLSRSARTTLQPAGRRAAFTLRLDTERHLQLRLASTVAGRSAQSLLTEALDRMIDEMPEIRSLAENVRKRS